MVVTPQSNVLAINLTYVLMESVLETKTFVKFNLLVQKIDHSGAKTRLVLLTKLDVIQNLSVQ